MPKTGCIRSYCCCIPPMATSDTHALNTPPGSRGQIQLIPGINLDIFTGRKVSSASHRIWYMKEEEIPCVREIK